MVEDSAAAFLDQHHQRGRVRGDREGIALWPGIVELGLPLVALDEAAGGTGLGAAGIVRLARLFGRMLVPEPLIAAAFIPATLATALPGTELGAAILAGIGDGARRCVLAWQEDARAIAAWGVTAAIMHGRLAGTKLLVPGSPTHLLVTAMAGEAPALCLLPVDAAGIRCDAQPGLGGGMLAQVRFDGVEVGGAPCVTGAAAGLAADRALLVGTLAHAARLLGLAEAAFALTLEHIKTRAQFGQTIGSFQAIQHRAVDLQIAIALSEASIDAAAAAFDSDPDGPAARAAISAAIARASAGGLLIAKESVQMHGAIGFTAEADIGLYVRALSGTGHLMGTARDHRRRFANLQEANLG